MFITKCKVTDKTEISNNKYYIFYERHKKSKRLLNSSYMLTEQNIKKIFSNSLTINKEFFLLYLNEYDYEPLAISFNGDFFRPIISKDRINPTQYQNRLLNITNNSFKMNGFSILHLSTFLSDDSSTFKYFSMGWLFSIIATTLFFSIQNIDTNSSGYLLFIISIMMMCCATTTKLRLLMNKLYLNIHKNKINKTKIEAISHDTNQDISLLKINKYEPTNDDKIIIDSYLYKKLNKEPTKIVQLQHQFYDGKLSSKQIYEILKNI